MTDEESESARQKEDQEVAILIDRLRRIGLVNLPREISDERFARRIIEGQLEIISIEARRLHNEKIQEELDDRLLSFQTSVTEKATAYNNAILTLGYAGFFAIWSILQENLSKADSLLIGVLLGFSLLVFVVWTLFSAILLSKSVSSAADVLSSEYETSEKRLEDFLLQDSKSQKTVMKVQKWWAFVFVLSVVPGLIAGMALLILLFLNVLGYDASVVDLIGELVSEP